MEVLYGAMSGGSRSLTIREFLHCYRPDEIDKSRGMYSFVPRKSILKVIYETPDSNRDWKSRYFLLEGDGWMCHSGETDFMPVDKTWGILDQFGIFSSVWYIFFNTLMTVLITLSLLFLQCDGVRKLISRSTTFWKEFFSKTKLEERTWAKLVNLNTVHRYCDGPEPTPAAIKYEERTRQRKSVTLYI